MPVQFKFFLKVASMYRFAEINMSNVHSVVHFRGAFKVILWPSWEIGPTGGPPLPLVSSCFGPFKNITLYSIPLIL